MYTKSINTAAPNNRKQRRVIRNDIVVAFEDKNSKKAYPLFVELLNISPQGMAIRCKKSLRVSKSLNLALNFRDGRNFYMKGRVVHKILEAEAGQSRIKRAFKRIFESAPTFYQYGIKFEAVGNDFQTTFIATKLQDIGSTKKQYQVDFIETETSFKEFERYQNMTRQEAFTKVSY